MQKAQGGGSSREAPLILGHLRYLSFRLLFFLEMSQSETWGEEEPRICGPHPKNRGCF